MARGRKSEVSRGRPSGISQPLDWFDLRRPFNGFQREALRRDQRFTRIEQACGIELDVERRVELAYLEDVAAAARKYRDARSRPLALELKEFANNAEASLRFLENASPATWGMLLGGHDGLLAAVQDREHSTRERRAQVAGTLLALLRHVVDGAKEALVIEGGMPKGRRTDLAASLLALHLPVIFKRAGGRPSVNGRRDSPFCRFVTAYVDGMAPDARPHSSSAILEKMLLIRSRRPLGEKKVKK